MVDLFPENFDLSASDFSRACWGESARHELLNKLTTGVNLGVSADRGRGPYALMPTQARRDDVRVLAERNEERYNRVIARMAHHPRRAVPAHGQSLPEATRSAGPRAHSAANHLHPGARGCPKFARSTWWVLTSTAQPSGWAPPGWRAKAVASRHTHGHHGFVTARTAPPK